jgi:hypothetical protein
MVEDVFALGTRSRVYSNNLSFPNIISTWVNGQGRLLGAYGIRATLVFTLQVSATPFHQGVVCLNFQYGADSFYNGKGLFFRSANSCTSTNLPSVRLDLSSDTMVQLKLPFLYPMEYAQIKSGQVYGFLALNTLTALPAVTGITAPTYQIYVHMEDIELFGATPQATVAVTLNAGRKLSPVAQEFAEETHVFSGATSALAKVARFVARGVPSLSWIAGPTGWALDHAAGVLKYFGYGKPQVTDPVMRTIRMDNVGEWNTDVATSTMVLAATANNATAISTGVGSSDVDEMAMKYVTSRWGQCCYFSYDTSVTSGGTLYVAAISPLCFWFRAPTFLPACNRPPPQFSGATDNSIQPTHIFFAANSFKQWRGGIKFRFTFAKTKMHAGRVIVSFAPDTFTKNNTDFLSTTTTVNAAAFGTSGADPFALSAVFDLKDGNVFEFEVPYMSGFAFSNTATVIGSLVMYVVNPLLAPSVVSSSIQVLVEVAGASDFEVANPTGIMFPVHNAGTIRVQSGRVLSTSPEELCQHTMGECITSVKQLISIPHNAPVVSAVVGSAIAVPPWFYTPTFSLLTPAPDLAGLNFAFSYGGNWASCYGFLKGGTDIHAYAPKVNLTLDAWQVSNSGGYWSNKVAPDNRSRSNACRMISTQNSLHARLPGFFPNSKVFSWIANHLTPPGTQWVGNPWTPTTYVFPEMSVQAVYILGASENIAVAQGSTFYLNRCASDDAQLAMYIGPPPLWLPTTNIYTGPFDSDSVTIGGV